MIDAKFLVFAEKKSAHSTKFLVFADSTYKIQPPEFVILR